MGVPRHSNYKETRNAKAPDTIARAQARGSVLAQCLALYRRRGTGLVRTLVVASATLTILGVCFTIYQFSLTDPDLSQGSRHPRLPSMPTHPFGAEADLDASESDGIPIGGGVVGPARRYAHLIEFGYRNVPPFPAWRKTFDSAANRILTEMGNRAWVEIKKK